MWWSTRPPSLQLSSACAKLAPSSSGQHLHFRWPKAAPGQPRRPRLSSLPRWTLGRLPPSGRFLPAVGSPITGGGSTFASLPTAASEYDTPAGRDLSAFAGGGSTFASLPAA